MTTRTGAQGHDDAAIREAAARGRPAHGVRSTTSHSLIDRTVDLLAAGKVIGWYAGPLRMGPARARSPQHPGESLAGRDERLVNTKSSFASPIGPFAPSALVERAARYLTSPSRSATCRPLHAARRAGRDEAAALFRPSRTWTAPRACRPSSRETNPRYHALIERFGQATGVPVLFNTSFNLRGEPIVNTPHEALARSAERDGRAGDGQHARDQGRSMKAARNLMTGGSTIAELLQFLWTRKL